MRTEMVRKGWQHSDIYLGGAQEQLESEQGRTGCTVHVPIDVETDGKRIPNRTQARTVHTPPLNTVHLAK